MSSRYKYNFILSKEDRLEIHLMLLHLKSIRVISNKFGLSTQFLRYLKEKTSDKVFPVMLGNKTSTYYENEDEYGTLNLKYQYTDELEKERPKQTELERHKAIEGNGATYKESSKQILSNETK